MIGLFIGVSILLGLVVVVGTAIMFFIHKDKKPIGFRNIFSAYFYLVAMISLLAVFIGASSVTKALASDVFGRDFSYYQYESRPELIDPSVESDDEKIAFAEEQREYEREQTERQYQEDLFNGISTTIVGLLFLVVHVIGWRRMESASERQGSFFYKGYLLLQLVLYSLIALITLPLGISQTLRYAMSSDLAGGVIPGETLSLAIWSTPLWIFFIWLTLRTMRKDKAAG